MVNEIALLAEAGVENAVLYWEEHPKTFINCGYPAHYIRETGLARMKRIAAFIKEWNPRIVYFHTVRDPDLISMVSRLKPAVIYMHDFYPVCPGLAKFYKIGQAICTRPYGIGCAAMIYLRRCASARHPLSVFRIMQTPPKFLAAYKQTKKVLVAGTYMKNLLIQNGFEAEHISILPFFMRMPGSRQPFENGNGPTRLLYIGRLEAEKGLEFLLKALSQVEQPFRLVVAGEGGRSETYMRIAEQEGIAGQVDFLGWVKAEELEALYQQTAFLVFPSIWPEPFGLVGMEAFYNSRPVIAFDVGGVSDWLVDGENGFLVPSQDVDELAKRIETLLLNHNLVNEMGANGYRYVDEHYSDEIHLEKLFRIFEVVAE